jgi:hypothetical protein
MTLRVLCLSAIAAALLMAAAVPTCAKADVQVGGLSCRSGGGVGFVVGAVLNFDCVFVPSVGGRPQHYVAQIRRIGVDLGYSQNVSMGWAVFSATSYIHPGDLTGNYGGVQGSATVGVGLGANALVGGSNNAFALQPVSGQAQTGLSVSAGFAGLELRPAGPYGYAPPHHYYRHHRH